MPGIARVRTIDGCVSELKQIDPGSQISRNFVRNLVLSGRVKYAKSGSKYLVNFDDLLAYLENPPSEPDNTSMPEYGKLRRIEA
jgi:excisionase family DNA binding protein